MSNNCNAPTGCPIMRPDDFQGEYPGRAGFGGFIVEVKDLSGNNVSRYVPRREYLIRVRNTRNSFRGFLLQTNTNPTLRGQDLVGRFTRLPELTQVGCGANRDLTDPQTFGAADHLNSFRLPLNNLEFVWIAPPKDTGVVTTHLIGVTSRAEWFGNLDRLTVSLSEGDSQRAPLAPTSNFLATCASVRYLNFDGDIGLSNRRGVPELSLVEIDPITRKFSTVLTLPNTITSINATFTDSNDLLYMVLSDNDRQHLARVTYSSNNNVNHYVYELVETLFDYGPLFTTETGATYWSVAYLTRRSDTADLVAVVEQIRFSGKYRWKYFDSIAEGGAPANIVDRKIEIVQWTLGDFSSRGTQSLTGLETLNGTTYDPINQYLWLAASNRAGTQLVRYHLPTGGLQTATLWTYEWAVDVANYQPEQTRWNKQSDGSELLNVTVTIPCIKHLMWNTIETSFGTRNQLWAVNKLVRATLRRNIDGKLENWELLVNTAATEWYIQSLTEFAYPDELPNSPRQFPVMNVHAQCINPIFRTFPDVGVVEICPSNVHRLGGGDIVAVNSTDWRDNRLELIYATSDEVFSVTVKHSSNPPFVDDSLVNTTKLYDFGGLLQQSDLSAYTVKHLSNVVLYDFTQAHPTVEFPPLEVDNVQDEPECSRDSECPGGQFGFCQCSKCKTYIGLGGTCQVSVGQCFQTRCIPALTCIPNTAAAGSLGTCQSPTAVSGTQYFGILRDVTYNSFLEGRGLTDRSVETNLRVVGINIPDDKPESPIVTQIASLISYTSVNATIMNQDDDLYLVASKRDAQDLLHVYRDSATNSYQVKVIERLYNYEPVVQNFDKEYSFVVDAVQTKSVLPNSVPHFVAVVQTIQFNGEFSYKYNRDLIGPIGRPRDILTQKLRVVRWKPGNFQTPVYSIDQSLEDLETVNATAHDIHNDEWYIAASDSKHLAIVRLELSTGRYISRRVLFQYEWALFGIRNYQNGNWIAATDRHGRETLPETVSIPTISNLVFINNRLLGIQRTNKAKIYRDVLPNSDFWDLDYANQFQKFTVVDLTSFAQTGGNVIEILDLPASAVSVNDTANANGDWVITWGDASFRQFISRLDLNTNTISGTNRLYDFSSELSHSAPYRITEVNHVLSMAFPQFLQPNVVCGNNSAYIVSITSEWSRGTSTGFNDRNFPPDAGVGDIIVITHAPGYNMDAIIPGFRSTTALDRYIHLGDSQLLLADIKAKSSNARITTGNSILTSPGTTYVRLEVGGVRTAATVLCRIRPSSDWFMAWRDVPLCDKAAGLFVRSRTTSSVPVFDAGLRSGDDFSVSTSLTLSGVVQQTNVLSGGTPAPHQTDNSDLFTITFDLLDEEAATNTKVSGEISTLSCQYNTVLLTSDLVLCTVHVRSINGQDIAVARESVEITASNSGTAQLITDLAHSSVWHFEALPTVPGTMIVSARVNNVEVTNTHLINVVSSTTRCRVPGSRNTTVDTGAVCGLGSVMSNQACECKCGNCDSRTGSCNSIWDCSSGGIANRCLAGVVQLRNCDKELLADVELVNDVNIQGNSRGTKTEFTGLLFAGSRRIRFSTAAIVLSGTNNKMTSAVMVDLCDTDFTVQGALDLRHHLDLNQVITCAQSTLSIQQNGILRMTPTSIGRLAVDIQNSGTMEFQAGSTVSTDDSLVNNGLINIGGNTNFNGPVTFGDTGTIQGTGTATFTNVVLSSGVPTGRVVHSEFRKTQAVTPTLQGSGRWGTSTFNRGTKLELDMSKSRTFTGDLILNEGAVISLANVALTQPPENRVDGKLTTTGSILIDVDSFLAPFQANAFNRMEILKFSENNISPGSFRTEVLLNGIGHINILTDNNSLVLESVINTAIANAAEQNQSPTTPALIPPPPMTSIPAMGTIVPTAELVDDDNGIDSAGIAGIIIGAIFGVLLILMLFVALIVYIKRRGGKYDNTNGLGMGFGSGFNQGTVPGPQTVPGYDYSGGAPWDNHQSGLYPQYPPDASYGNNATWGQEGTYTRGAGHSGAFQQPNPYYDYSGSSGQQYSFGNNNFTDMHPYNYQQPPTGVTMQPPPHYQGQT